MYVILALHILLPVGVVVKAFKVLSIVVGVLGCNSNTYSIYFLKCMCQL
jgi:hypothetical protein